MAIDLSPPSGSLRHIEIGSLRTSKQKSKKKSFKKIEALFSPFKNTSTLLQYLHLLNLMLKFYHLIVNFCGKLELKDKDMEKVKRKSESASTGSGVMYINHTRTLIVMPGSSQRSKIH